MYKDIESIREKFSLSYSDVGRIFNISYSVIFKIIRDKNNEYVNSKRPNNRLDTDLLSSISDKLIPKIKDMEPIKVIASKEKEKLINAIKNREYDYVVDVFKRFNDCYESEKLVKHAIEKI